MYLITFTNMPIFENKITSKFYKEYIDIIIILIGYRKLREENIS